MQGQRGRPKKNSEEIESGAIESDAIFNNTGSGYPDDLQHQIVSPEGWENDMESAPIDGSRVMISETGLDQGQLVYWRISKFVDKKNLRYIPRGRWTDFLTKIDITFVPKYWKPYNPEEYWPLQKA